MKCLRKDFQILTSHDCQNLNPFRSTTEWALLTNEEEKINSLRKIQWPSSFCVCDCFQAVFRLTWWLSEEKVTLHGPRAVRVRYSHGSSANFLLYSPAYETQRSFVWQEFCNLGTTVKAPLTSGPYSSLSFLQNQIMVLRSLIANFCQNIFTNAALPLRPATSISSQICHLRW